MDSKPKRGKFYSIMIVPHDARGTPVSLKVPARWVYTAIFSLLFCFILVGSSLIYSTFLSRRLVHYADTLSKNREQRSVISSFSEKTNKVKKEIDELEARDNELRRLLGLRNWRSKARFSDQKSALDINLVKAKLEERKSSLGELKNWVTVVRTRLSTTPSTWPIAGRIVSFFGYRAYPWRGFHGGIDIQAKYGAPARSTAAGVVSFIGWRNGYGKTVEINHGNGISTLYAHNSRYAVNVGQKVKKGQVICFVGTTGWTTGPHLHYEVHRFGRAFNPTAYLNLNIFSASRLYNGR